MSDWTLQHTNAPLYGTESNQQLSLQQRLEREFEELRQKNAALKEQHQQLEVQIAQQERINQTVIENENLLRQKYRDALDERRQHTEHIRQLQAVIREKYAQVDERQRLLATLQAQRREILSDLTDLQALQSRAAQLYSQYAVCDTPEFLYEALNSAREKFNALHREVQNQAAVAQMAREKTQ